MLTAIKLLHTGIWAFLAATILAPSHVYGDVVTDEMAQAHSKVVGLALAPPMSD